MWLRSTFDIESGVVGDIILSDCRLELDIQLRIVECVVSHLLVSRSDETALDHTRRLNQLLKHHWFFRAGIFAITPVSSRASLRGASDLRGKRRQVERDVVNVRQSHGDLDNLKNETK